MRRPVWPMPQGRRERPCGAPVVVPRADGERLRPSIKYPAHMLGLPLVRFADSEAFPNRIGDALATLNVPIDAGTSPRHGAFED